MAPTKFEQSLQSKAIEIELSHFPAVNGNCTNGMVPALSPNFLDEKKSSSTGQIYNSLCETIPKSSDFALFDILGELSPQAIATEEISNEPLFPAAQRNRRTEGLSKQCLILWGVSILAAVLALTSLALAYILLKPQNSNFSEAKISRNELAVQLILNSSAVDSNQRSNHEDTDEAQEKIIQVNMSEKAHWTTFVVFPIPDVMTRSVEEFKAALFGSPATDNWTKFGKGHPSFVSSFPPTANLTIATEAIREGADALVARQLTEDRILKLGIGPNKSYYDYITYSSSNEESDKVHKLSLIGFSMERASRKIAKKLNLSKHEVEEGIVLDSSVKIEPNQWCSDLAFRLKTCNGSVDSWNIDGSCNNMNHPLWGSKLQSYRRILNADYADSISSSRKSAGGLQLASPFSIAEIIFRNTTFFLEYMKRSNLSLFFPLWAEFIQRDMSQIVPSTGENNSGIVCCEKGKKLEIQHPECFPITNRGDESEHCLSIVRSAASPACEFGPREQFNMNTAFIDGLPTVYRESQGKVVVIGEMWKAHHKQIAKDLKALNFHWEESRIFLETRRILVAEIQLVTLKEYLPLLLGPTVIRRGGLDIVGNGYYQGYSKMINPGISNVFSSTVSMFHLGMLPLLSKSNDSKIFTVNPFLNIDSGNQTQDLKLLIRQYAFYVNGLPVGASEKVELINQVEKLTKHIAVVVQRGRDHGIPSYPKWRNLCTSHDIQSWTDLEGIWEAESILKAKQVYELPSDIDLFVGGLLEIRERALPVGPTFACVVADQFARIRQGDRFWFDGDIQLKPFSLAQINRLRNVTLASILCRVVENLGAIQGLVLGSVTIDNPILPCSSILDSSKLILEPWKEEKPLPGIQFEVLPNGTIAL